MRRKIPKCIGQSLNVLCRLEKYFSGLEHHWSSKYTSTLRYARGWLEAKVMNAVRYLTLVHTKVIFSTDISTLNSLLQQHKTILLHAPTVSDIHIDISLILRPLKAS